MAVTSPGKSMVAAASKGRGIGRGNFYFMLDLADDQVIDHTTHYHIADLDSWLPGLVKPFITSLRLYSSQAYI